MDFSAIFHKRNFKIKQLGFIFTENLYEITLKYYNGQKYRQNGETLLYSESEKK
jgi:hypothetical protein